MMLSTLVTLCFVTIVVVGGQSTWYQDGAILQVDGGVLSVNLIKNALAPTELNAAGKNIKDLPKGFAIIPQLRRITLEDNMIEEIHHSFSGLPGLLELNLQGNNIKDLERDCFRGLDKLKVLNLDHNSLSILDFAFLEYLPDLTHLYLRHNQISTLGCSTCAQLFPKAPNGFRLTHLYLSDNGLRSGRDLAEYGLINLSHLYMEGNNMIKISQSVSLDKLETLSLDRIAFWGIPQIIAPNLKFLSLAGNHLEVIRAETFERFKNLSGLVLSNCTIDYFDTDAITDMPFLEYLALDGIGLSKKPPVSYRGLPLLKTLKLGHNKLSSIQGLEDLPSLRRLDVSHNSVADLMDLNVDKLQRLEHLVITGNPLKRMRIEPLPSILTIIL